MPGHARTWVVDKLGAWDRDWLCCEWVDFLGGSFGLRSLLGVDFVLTSIAKCCRKGALCKSQD